MTHKKHNNRLINETSPYLLQHAHNPVNWFPWGDEAWELAKKENKPVIISIGYSACHWCHVMERDSFEDEEVAAIMNTNFVCIKVDREERPDIDNVYMEAVQLMTGRGGWPLNCIVLPNGKPIYGGTFFPKHQWIDVLIQISEAFVNNKEKVNDFANRLVNRLLEYEALKNETSLNNESLQNSIDEFTSKFDNNYGGSLHVPKFLMPCNYRFLLNYGVNANDAKILAHVKLTLQKFCRGGIHDHLVGGFARYAVDAKWLVPHFEKMLYDNAQIISLYSLSYGYFREIEFKQTVINTIQFCNKELKNTDGVFCSALDADSDGVEGKYYVWKIEEIKNLLSENEFKFALVYYGINENGYWESNNYILNKQQSDDWVIEKFGLSITDFFVIRENVKEKLLNYRKIRVKPGLDDKCILGWNALLLEGYANASIYIDSKFYQSAKDLYNAIKKCFYSENSWFRIYKNGKSSILAFSEDLSLLVSALISLYEVECDFYFLHEAQILIETLMNEFYNKQTGLFYFNSKNTESLIISRSEIFDNVIPGSNSLICKALYYIGIIQSNDQYVQTAQQMLDKIKGNFANASSAMGNWLDVFLMMREIDSQLVITGPAYIEGLNQIRKKYFPATIWCASDNENHSSLLTNRVSKHETFFYECKNKACNLPIQLI